MAINLSKSVQSDSMMLVMTEKWNIPILCSCNNRRTRNGPPEFLYEIRVIFQESSQTFLLVEKRSEISYDFRNRM
jgi:hypothetical protein